MADSYEIIADSCKITLFYQSLLFLLYRKKYERDSDKDRNDTNRSFPSLSCLNDTSTDDSILQCTRMHFPNIKTREKLNCDSSALKKTVTSQKNILSQKTVLSFTVTV